MPYFISQVFTRCPGYQRDRSRPQNEFPTLQARQTSKRSTGAPPSEGCCCTAPQMSLLVGPFRSSQLLQHPGLLDLKILLSWGLLCQVLKVGVHSVGYEPLSPQGAVLPSPSLPLFLCPLFLPLLSFLFFTSQSGIALITFTVFSRGN